MGVGASRSRRATAEKMKISSCLPCCCGFVPSFHTTAAATAAADDDDEDSSSSSSSGATTLDLDVVLPSSNNVLRVSANSSGVAAEKNAVKSVEKLADIAVADKNLCTICLELLINSSDGIGDVTTLDRPSIFTARCMHSFHYHCIASNIRHGNVTCPICRAPLPQLPRDLMEPPVCRHSDPVLRILDDSIATSRINRQSSLRAARYNDDEPVEDAAATPVNNSSHPCLEFALNSSAVAVDRNLSTTPLYDQFHFTSSVVLSCSKRATSLGTQRQTYLSVRLAPLPAADLVLILSPSSSAHLRLLKQSAKVVISSLRPVDRLSIVACSNAVARVLPLRRMHSQGKLMALQVVDRISYTRGADLAEGLQKVAKVLDDRTHRNPRSVVLHLSGDTTNCQGERQLEESMPIIWFQVSSGFRVHEFQDFVDGLIRGVIGDAQLRIGEAGVIGLGELRGGEERRVPTDATVSHHGGSLSVSYSYVAGRDKELITGKAMAGFGEKSGGLCYDRQRSCGGVERHGRYADRIMARRWARRFEAFKV